MRRGEIRLIDLDPARSGEAITRRPAVIVSNDNANRTAATLGRGVITVVPITSNTEVIHPFQVFLDAADTGLRIDGTAQAEQVRSVSVQHVGAALGRLPVHLTAKLDEALRVHLQL